MCQGPMRDRGRLWKGAVIAVGYKCKWENETEVGVEHDGIMLRYEIHQLKTGGGERYRRYTRQF